MVSTRTLGARAKAAPSGYGAYQLDVSGRDVADVVQHVGGWLYDRARAGWDVAVAVSDGQDVTALRILGVRTERPGPDGDATAPPRAFAVAASVGAIADDDTLRHHVTTTLKRGVAEVTLWGGAGDEATGVAHGATPVEYVLSAAARAFKTQALRAAGIDEPAGPVEVLRRRATGALAG